MQMSYLYASGFPFKSFCTLAQHAETIRKNVWEKSKDAYSLSIRVHTTIKHKKICFLPQYEYQRKCFFFFFFSEKKVLRDTMTRAGMGQAFFDWFVLIMRMQAI